MSVDRLAANAVCPFARRVSYQLGTEAISGRFWPELSVPRIALLAAGAARNVTGLAAPGDGTMQSAARTELTGSTIATMKAMADGTTDERFAGALQENLEFIFSSLDLLTV